MGFSFIGDKTVDGVGSFVNKQMGNVPGNFVEGMSYEDAARYNQYMNECMAGTHNPYPGMSDADLRNWQLADQQNTNHINISKVDGNQLIDMRLKDAELQNMGDVGGTAGGTEGKLPPLENGPYIKNGKPNGRPSLSGEAKLQFEKDVYNNCVDPDGILRDPNTGEEINWKPGESRNGVVDFGHNQGSSYSEMFQKYKNREITLEELKEFQFNPNNYRLETPSANRSHKYE